MEDLASLPEMDGPYDPSADAFYEEIEAPKFVDLTDKDPIRVDDRYWFCSRVGCDQKHEEELDSEEVFKTFVLRVMAARSPNVRLQKALSRRCGAMTKLKCPQSAPPKSTRPPVSRLALVSSSMATRIDGLKPKCNQQRTKASATPNAKVKVVGAKYMTTPRNKNPELKPKCPQSAPPKSTRPPVSRLAMVSSSMATRIDGLKPKCNQLGRKASVTPNAKVKVVGAKYLTTPRNKNSELKNDAFHSVQNPKKGEACVGEVKSRVAKALVFHSPKKTVKLKASLELKTPVRKICEKLKKLELDEESRKKRVLGYSPNTTTSASASKPKANTIRPWRVDNSRKVKKVGVAENKKRKSNDMSQPCDKLLKSPDENEASENLEQVGKQEVLQETKASEEPQPAPILNDNIVVAADDDDDKENESGTNQNRCKSGAKPEDAPSAGRKVPTSEKTSNKLFKMTKPVPNRKEGGAASNVLIMKYRKLKPTDPKPFHLRTDERGILKEANSGKRIQSAGKCHGDIVSESENKPACKKITKLNSNKVKEVQDKPPSLTRTLKPSSTRTTLLEHSKAITAAKMVTTTPEKTKSILVSSTKRKTVTPNRENTARKPTVSFKLPGEKTPEVLSAAENPGKVSIKNSSSALAEKSPIPKNSSSAGKLP